MAVLVGKAAAGVAVGDGVLVGPAVRVGKAAVGVTAAALHPTSRDVVTMSASKKLIIC